MEIINKRMIVFFSIITVFAAALIFRLSVISSNERYAESALRQSRYTVTVSETRGTIYDCKLRPISGSKAVYKAVVCGSDPETAEILKNNLSEEKYEKIRSQLASGYPFPVIVDNGALESTGIDVFKTTQRYSSQHTAAHVTGYLDYSNSDGITGIEEAFDSWLDDASGALRVTYSVDAKGGIINSDTPEIDDTTYKSKQGVVLTLDVDIQEIVQKAAADCNIKSGAIVVMEIPSGDIRAFLSLPEYSPTDVASVLNDISSPLVNRVLSSYDVGSVFKLVTAAAALEKGYSPSTQFKCDGYLQVGSTIFTCSNGTSHGVLNLEGALCYSCNLYFIQLAQQLSGTPVLQTAKELGLGRKTYLAETLVGASGVLPDYYDLIDAKALANFSFGQGKLLVTPVQVASLIGTIASDGEKVVPRLVEKTVDYKGNLVTSFESSESSQVLSEKTAKKLRECMYSCVTAGTGKSGRSDIVSSAAKTGTAETGILIDGIETVQAWYAGFFPYENPKYVCVVLAENGVTGGKTAGPVFKQISENMVNYIK